MTRSRRFRRVPWLSFGRRDRIQAEVDEEIAFHLRARVEQLVRRGWSPDEAYAEAQRRFGTAHGSRRRLHASAATKEQRLRTRERWGALRRDVEFAVRSLRRNQGFAALTAVTLLLAIGANAATFGLVRAVLLRTPPYADPSRLVMVWQDLPALGGKGHLGASPPEYVDYRDRNRVFASVAGFRNEELDLTGDGYPERMAAARVTSSLFVTLGVNAYLGRTFGADDDREGAPRVVVLGYGLWQRRFAGDPGVVGRTLRLDERPYTVIGVMPRGFEFPWDGTPLSRSADLWIPMAFSTAELQARAESYDVLMVARLKPGVTLPQARGDVTRIIADARHEYPDIYSGNVQTQATADWLVADATDTARPLLLTLLGAVVLVLLIACANAANLILGRAITRQHEISVRRALGAGAGQAVRPALIEVLLLAGAGGAGGVGLAYLLVAFVRRFGPAEIPGLTQARFDAPVLAFTVVLTLIAATVCGVGPAMRLARREARDALGHGNRVMGGWRGRHRGRRLLVVIEAASAMALLVSAGLLIRSFIRVLQVSPGFDSHGVAIARTSFDRNRYPTDQARTTAERAILARLAALPEVGAVSLTTQLPLVDERRIGFTVEGRDPNEYHWADNALVGEDYFRVMRIPLRGGRTFSSMDRPDAPLAAVINETMARRYWPNADPVGHAVYWGGRRLTIVGVVSDVRVSALDAPVRPMLYNSLFQIASGATQFAVFVVRTRRAEAASALFGAIRRAVWSVDRGLPVFGGTTLDDVVSRALATRRFLVWLLTGFAITAGVLVMVGMYGVLSYAVVQRTRELGVRAALGARPRDAWLLVVRSGLALAAAGIAGGALVAAVAGTTIARLLFDVRPLDPVSYLAAGVLLAGISLVASWVPARRASRLDPMVALRTE